jgi:threonine aldolase
LNREQHMTKTQAIAGQDVSSERRARFIDLRSDTVTQPSAEMRQAMAEAEVGDDVYGEDPTINRLEQRASEIFRREAAIFVPTGSMGNQIAIKIHTQPGQEIICEERAHVYNWEMATLSSFSGCVVRPIPSATGIITWTDIQPRVAPRIYYRAQSGLIVLENTHNMAGGAVTPIEVTADVCAQAKAVGIPVHLDGARVFNAATALGCSVAELTSGFDSVMFCLSKGLGAPVGSMLLGSQAFIDQARVYRKALGGGMRQAGVLAAAGLIALEKMPTRLQEDHANAQLLARGLQDCPGIRLSGRVETNIVICELIERNAPDVVKELLDRRILVSAISPKQIRFVTHMDVNREQCQMAVDAIVEILKA